MNQEIEQLNQRINTLSNAQDTQYDTLLTNIRSVNQHVNENVRILNTWFDKIDMRFTTIEENLSKIQDVLHSMAFMIRKMSGDNPDNQYERMGEDY